MEKQCYFKWKYVQKSPDHLSENSIRESSLWFKDRTECIQNAKVSYHDKLKQSKLVIIRKLLPTYLADEVDSADIKLYIESLLTLCYSIEIAKHIKRMAKELCFGCMFDEEAVHTCLDMNDREKVEHYYSMTWSELDEIGVIHKWISMLRNDPQVQDRIPSSMLHSYQCQDYLNVCIKTTKWFETLKSQVLKYVQLERLFPC